MSGKWFGEWFGGLAKAPLESPGKGVFLLRRLSSSRGPSLMKIIAQQQRHNDTDWEQQHVKPNSRKGQGRRISACPMS